MKNFIFKSTAADLQKMFQTVETIQKNVLYLTYRLDMLIKTCNKMVLDKGLQKQVDEYFEDGARVGLEDTRDDSDNRDNDNDQSTEETG